MKAKSKTKAKIKVKSFSEKGCAWFEAEDFMNTIGADRIVAVTESIDPSYSLSVTVIYKAK